MNMHHADNLNVRRLHDGFECPDDDDTEHREGEGPGFVIYAFIALFLVFAYIGTLLPW